MASLEWALLGPALSGAGILAADQISKYFALSRSHPVAVTAARPFLAIHCIVNKRGALLPLARRPLRIAAFVLCIAFALVALMQEPLMRNAWGATGIGIALGGIVGNFIDLLRRGGVIDFIAVGRLSIFNIADLAIVGGLALALWALV
ncbi:MAG: signal peptidase II [Pseudolabrys sp.]|jgi:signal peptidase II